MSDPIIIKKYANRRLYNTETSTYITLSDLADIIRSGKDVEVVDAKTAHDLTRQTLAQIILEEDSKGAAMLPTSFLKNVISFYDNSLQTVVPHYLEMVMDVFRKNQNHIREETNRALGGFSPFMQLQAMQQLQRKQLEQMQQVMGLFNPFLRAGMMPTNPLDDSQEANPQEDPRDRKIRALEAEIARLKTPQPQGPRQG